MTSQLKTATIRLDKVITNQITYPKICINNNSIFFVHILQPLTISTSLVISSKPGTDSALDLSLVSSLEKPVSRGWVIEMRSKSAKS
jgi:hypothetical protein